MSHPTLNVDAVSKQYLYGDACLFALENVSLQIHRSDVYGIIGMSGAGKSTLLRCLCGLIHPTSGAVRFHGASLRDMSFNELRVFRRKIGMIFQHFNLLSSRNVAGNIAYAMEITGISKEKQNERIDELLKLVGLEDKKNAYPSQLSGGQKQRVAIARALANRPEVLLCDEATSALDPKTTREILGLLKSINQDLGVTLVLITHEMEVVRQICTKVAVLEKGRLVEQGAATGVLADPQHEVTQHLLENSRHELPAEFFEKSKGHGLLIRLHFKGHTTSEPIICELVRKFNINVNILMGWVDRVQSMMVGTLIIELTGSHHDIERSLCYLQAQSIHYEVLRHES